MTLQFVGSDAYTVYVPEAPSEHEATPALLTETSVVGTPSEQAPQTAGMIGVTIFGDPL